jgi:hypothetical protein
MLQEHETIAWILQKIFKLNNIHFNPYDYWSLAMGMSFFFRLNLYLLYNFIKQQILSKMKKLLLM